MGLMIGLACDWILTLLHNVLFRALVKNLNLICTLHVDVPLIPTGLSLLPDPENSTQLVFSWVAPADTLDGVVVTYTPTLTGISLDRTNNTFVKFDDDPSLECLARLFSVFASNDAGDGPTESITETIPICACVGWFVCSWH